ncbi:retrovirus-related pol polyprotein from transposon TNT 1-94 [Tanacetum coccineum]|uniref:Retrovirus-related pol polyprotein from transposon TNT 1-94 n=1 Tax=Tanacetum coccineum TaxID=301880 RepID=A0ABQ5C6J7_9ASTR
MFGTVQPILPPLETTTGSPSTSSSNCVDTIPTDNTNNTTTNNVAHEGPSNTRDTKIASLRLKFNVFKALEGEKVNGTFTRPKCLINDLKNNGITIPQAEVNATFVNSLPRKWLSMNQTQRANNSIKNNCLATLYGKYNYEEGLIDHIYDNSDVEEDLRSSSEFIADLNIEYHERALLANQKRFYKRSGRKIDAMSKGKSEKGLVVESFEWDEESVSSDDEGVTKVKAFMAIAEDEPAVGKGDARLDEISNLKKVIEKWTSSRVTLDQLLTEQAVESPSETVPKLTSDSKSECDNPEPLPSLPKLLEAEPKIKKVPDKRLAIKVIKKKAQPMTSSVLDLSLVKKIESSTKQLLLTLMEEVKAAVRKSLAMLKAQSSQGSSSRKAPMIPMPYIDYKYCGFNDHHSNECGYYPGCDICGLLKVDSGCSRHMTGVKQYLHRYLKESGPKVVFGDNSSGDTKGYGSVNYNGITFTRVAYVNVSNGSGIRDYPTSTSKTSRNLQDEYSRYTWVFFLKKKSDAADYIMSFIRKMENLNEVRVKELRSDNGTEFINHKLEEFCDEKGISQNFSSPCTPEQNGVAERRNITFIEAARTMLNSANILKQFLGEAVNTACYT